MSDQGSRDRHPLSQRRAELADRLLARFDEIEDAVLTHVITIDEADRSLDPIYAMGLERAVTEALKYGIEVIARGERRAPTVPPTLRSQARMAARYRIELDVVMRRYLAGYTLLGDFAAEEAARDGLLGIKEARRLSRDQTALVNRLIPTVIEEFRQETLNMQRSTGQRRTERLRGLLDGELLDTSEFDYDFEAWHTGVATTGPEASAALKDLAHRTGRLLLLAPGDDGGVWAWFGGRQPLSSAELKRTAAQKWPPSSSLAIGEPARGLPGWRFTNRQAREALAVALDRPMNILCYADDALFVSMRNDNLLVRSLTQIYLAPLAEEPDGGETLRGTLRAYFAAKGNVSSTASALKISRKTVTKRLAKVEKRIGRPVDSCSAELEGALRLHDSKDPLTKSAGSNLGPRNG